MKQGSLTVVGTGINVFAHCSLETRGYIEQADIVYMLVTDIFCQDWVKELNPNVVSLQHHYRFGKVDSDDFDLRQSRAKTYENMVQTLVTAVHQGKSVVAIFYGHPGVFANPPHEAIRRLRAEGYEAQMRPGISAEDCLFADLNVDPCEGGCAQYEATSFLFSQIPVNTSAGLILWQIGVVGDHTLQRLCPGPQGLAALAKKLQKFYPADHQVVIYEAAGSPLAETRIDWMALAALGKAEVSLASTLFVPPSTPIVQDVDEIQAFGLDPSQLLLS